MGLGHISRCLALADLLSGSYAICFAVRDPHKTILYDIGRITSDIIILKSRPSAGVDLINDLEGHLSGKEIVILDGYHFDTIYEKELKKRAGAVVRIDDIPSQHFVADVIINFCGDLNAESYSKEFYTQLFMGIEYLFLRSPFLRKGPDKHFNNRLFINMGGTDPQNNTVKVLSRLIELNHQGDIDVVVSDQYQFHNTLEPIIQKHNTITLYQALSAHEMYRLMANCSTAILPPSTVALEFLSTGGLAFLHKTAENQSMLKKYLIDLNLASDFNNFHVGDKALFERRLKLQKKIFDGSSMERVHNIFRKVSLGTELTLRRADLDDMNLCFQWANDPEARKFSYSSEPIPWDRHVLWFKGKINDPHCFYFIASIGKAQVGQIRFELNEQSDYQISYSIDKDWRGKGLSHFLLSRAVQKLKTVVSAQKIVGFVQKTNLASIRTFQGAGFEMSLTNAYPDSFKFELI